MVRIRQCPNPQNPRLLRVPQNRGGAGDGRGAPFGLAPRDLHHFADPARAKQTLLGLGPWGYLAFVAAYAILQPFGVPGTVFIMVAPLVWPWPVAFLLSMAGTMAASLVGFSFARFVARDLVAARYPGAHSASTTRRWPGGPSPRCSCSG